MGEGRGKERKKQEREGGRREGRGRERERERREKGGRREGERELVTVSWNSLLLIRMQS